ncbi:hypothetical protein GCM10009576_079720 [Streptomyces rhizosphaericus]|uniref:Uncharacterized protein n=1 Tax=Streptomyces rhizosphaericus TaxID=114699 RepID=A0ABN1SLF9_9ACTN
MATPAEKAPKAAETASVGEPSHSATPMTSATPHAPRTATMGSVLVRSIASPVRAVSFNACDQVIRRDYGVAPRELNQPFRSPCVWKCGPAGEYVYS